MKITKTSLVILYGFVVAYTSIMTNDMKLVLIMLYIVLLFSNIIFIFVNLIDYYKKHWRVASNNFLFKAWCPELISVLMF
uniref:Uncharacterized protein n=1 Tax=Staphylococcus aureus TaxID=1280 RepID=A0A499S369_STAAU|nr:hypothetical protein D0Y80_l00165 [Staphylococcus aureus]